MIISPDRRTREHPLDNLANIPRAALARLASLGITTVAELRDLWAFGDRTKLLDYLGESPSKWFSHPQPLSGAFRGGGGDLSDNPLSAAGLVPLRHPRGLLAQDPAQPAPAPAPLDAGHAPATPNGADLRQRFPGVRDQGGRGTCVAFASAALFEFHRCDASDDAHRHSEQFLFWACKQRDGFPDKDASFLAVAREVLCVVGLCRDRTWPYADVSIPGNPGHHPPPGKAETEAAANTRQLGQCLDDPKDPARLCRLLDKGRPVAVGVETFDAWDYPNATMYGEIYMPLPNETRDGGHAVVIVGYELREGIPGGGRFIFRNSWGSGWAANGDFGPGYGTLFFDYLRNHGLEAVG